MQSAGNALTRRKLAQIAVAGTTALAADPMSFEEVATKFLDNARFAKWPAAKASAIVESVRKLEDIPDVRTITALLSA